jgi:hypothetical protein
LAGAVDLAARRSCACPGWTLLTALPTTQSVIHGSRGGYGHDHHSEPG